MDLKEIEASGFGKVQRRLSERVLYSGMLLEEVVNGLLSYVMVYV